jgi:hypothetical protein
MKREYFYDPTMGVAHCVLTHKGQAFGGTATCHPEDGDFMSERTGLYIAETRANIRYLKSKKPELRAAITALQHAVNCMRDSKDFNPKAKEFQIVYRLLYDKKSELDSLNSRIKMEKEYLEDYIKNKDIVHNKMRKGKPNQVNE